MATQTAIEYAGRRVRLLEFDGTARKLRVLGVQEVDLDVPPSEEGGPDPDDVRARAIAAAMKDAGFATDPSGMAFDAGHAMFREFDLPFTNEEQIAKVVRFESESHFPGDIDEVVIQHIVLRKLRDKSHLLVAAVRKDDLLDRLDILEESGLDPQFVDIDVFSMYHALVGTGLADEHPRMIVVDADTSTTTLMFLVDGSLFAVRSIRIGSHGVAAGAPDALAPDEDGERAAPASTAGAAAAARGAAREAELETARTHDYLTRLTREIRRTLSTLSDFGTADALYVTGSGSRLPGIRESMSAAFGLQAKQLNLLERVDHKLTEAEVERYGPEFGAPLGVAYKLCGLDRTHTDFRREEAAYTRKFDQVKTPLIVLALMIFLVTAFQGLHAYMDVKRLKLEYGDQILATGDRQLAQLFDSEDALEAARARVAAAEFGPRRVQVQLSEIQKLGEDIKQRLGRSNTIPELRSALGAWIELFDVIRTNEDAIGRLALTRVDIEASGKEPTIKLSGEMEDLTHLSAFMDLLKARPMFTEANVGQTKPTPKGTLSFTDVTVKLNLQAGVSSGGGEQLMFKSWDFERALLVLLVLMILACVGFIIWQRSVAEDLRSHMGTAEKQLTQIGELAAEIIRLQEEMRDDSIASNKTGPLPYIEEQETSSRIGKKFTISNTTDPHPSEGFEDTRYVLTPAQADYDTTLQDIANFLLHVEGNTTRMKATRIKLDLSTRRNAASNLWKPTFTITDRKPLVKG